MSLLRQLLIRDNWWKDWFDLQKEEFAPHKSSKNSFSKWPEWIHGLNLSLSDFFVTFNAKLNYSKLQIFFLKRVGEAKILRNSQGGLDAMLIVAYIVGGWVQKSQKSAYVIYGRSH